MIGALEKIGESYQSQFNAGFLTHLYLLRTDTLVYTNFPSQISVEQQWGCIGIEPNSTITEFLIKTKTAIFSETSSPSPDGIYYSMQLSFPMKGPAREITNWIYINGQKRFVILCRDTLGNCYMAGSFENGVRVNWSRQVAGQNLHQLSFSLIHWHPIQFIPTVDLDQLLPIKYFDNSFDLSFS